MVEYRAMFQLVPTTHFTGCCEAKEIVLSEDKNRSPGVPRLLLFGYDADSRYNPYRGA